MAFFRTTERKAQISPAAPEVKAAAASSYNATNQVGTYYSYFQGTARDIAMRIPAVSRSRDLHASIISSMGLKMYRETWNETDRVMRQEDLAPRSWLRRPDPAIPYETLMAFTLDDLFFTGRAFWAITSRYSDGYPASYTRLPAAMINTQDQAGPVFFAPSNDIEFNGMPVDPINVVQFISPVQGIIYMSQQTISTALKIEESRFRNAATALPTGILRQTAGEPLSAAELADIGQAFNAARLNNQTAVLNEFLEYEFSNTSPDKQLMIDSANYSALDLSRLCNVPPYLLGISTGSYAYTNSRESRIDLWVFGSKIYAECIAATLSSDHCLPHGTYVEFDTNDLTREFEETREQSDQPQENTQEALA